MTSTWQSLPMVSVFLLLIPSGLPMHSLLLTHVAACLPLLAVFYWGMWRPSRIGFLSLFVAGLLQDALLSTPFGSTAMLWLLFRYLLMINRKEVSGQGFLAGWAFCALLLALVLVLQWMLIGYYVARSLPFMPVLVQWAMGVLLYPPMHALLHRTERVFHRRYWFMLKTA